MGQLFFKTASIAAASQFLGTELSAASAKANRVLLVKEVLLKMGSEAKTWSIQKVYSQGGGTVRSVLLSASASTATDVAMRDADAAIYLFPGEQIQVQTTGATAAMTLRVQYEELDNTATRSALDPHVTR